jgi:hypothetical protein
MRRRPTFAAVLSALLLIAGDAGGQQPFSTEPLSVEPYHDAVSWAIDAVSLNNWLNSYADSLPEGERPGVRAHLYHLISTLARRWYQAEGDVAYRGDNPVVPLLFNWAGHFGAYGTDLVVGAIDGQFGPRPGPPLPEGFEIGYDPPLLRLSGSTGGWSIRLPYYFMLWGLERRTELGASTDLVTMSTLFARHSEDDGFSQSTVLLIASEFDIEMLKQAWVERLQLDPGTARGGREIPAAEWLRGAPKPDGMLSEAHFLTTPAGSVAVFYAGMPGTYEINRPNYIDVIRSIEYGRPAGPEER